MATPGEERANRIITMACLASVRTQALMLSRQRGRRHPFSLSSRCGRWEWLLSGEIPQGGRGIAALA